MHLPRVGEKFLLQEAARNPREFGVAIDAAQKWRLSEPTYDAYEHWDGEEPEPIGNVKYHEIKSYSSSWITVSAPCALHCMIHLQEGFDTLFWIYLQYDDGVTYQFRGVALFSDIQNILEESDKDDGFRISNSKIRPLYLDLSAEQTSAF